MPDITAIDSEYPTSLADAEADLRRYARRRPQGPHGVLAAELDRLRALQPPAHLPATLATVDDAERFLRAVGARSVGNGVWWTDDARGVKAEVQFEAHRGRYCGLDLELHTDDPDADEDDEILWVLSLYPGTPTAIAWHAVQAARSTS